LPADDGFLAGTAPAAFGTSIARRTDCEKNQRFLTGGAFHLRRRKLDRPIEAKIARSVT
jgi:hypothetical protein